MHWKPTFALALLMLAGTAQAQDMAQALTDAQARIGVAAFTAPDYHPGDYRHIVLFKYKESVSKAERQDVIRRFLALKQDGTRNGKPYIVDIVTGEQASGEGAQRGMEQAFIVTFRSEGDRNYYVGTPLVRDSRYYDRSHAAFKDFVGPLLASDQGVLVFDFRSGD